MNKPYLVLEVELIRQNYPMKIPENYMTEVKNYLKRTSYPNRILKTVNCQWNNPENLLNRQKMILKSLNREL